MNKDEQETPGKALTHLNALVLSGVEYPDAEYRIAKKFEIPADQLRAQYDGQFNLN